MFHIHIPIWQHGSCIHQAMATKPHPKLINYLHQNTAIQLTLYINQCIQYNYPDQILSALAHNTYTYTKYITFQIQPLCLFHYFTCWTGLISVSIGVCLPQKYLKEVKILILYDMNWKVKHLKKDITQLKAKHIQMPSLICYQMFSRQGHQTETWWPNK